MIRWWVQLFPSSPNSYSPIRSIDSHIMALFSKNPHIPTAAYRTWTSSSTTTSIAPLCVYCSVDICRTHDADTAFHWPLSAKTRTVNEMNTLRNEEEDQIEHLRLLTIVVWRSRRRIDLCNFVCLLLDRVPLSTCWTRSYAMPAANIHLDAMVDIFVEFHKRT